MGRREGSVAAEADRSTRERARATTLALVRAALDAVDPFVAVRRALELEAGALVVGGRRLPLEADSRIVVVGGGKAGAAMAAGVEAALGVGRSGVRLEGSL